MKREKMKRYLLIAAILMLPTQALAGFSDFSFGNWDFGQSGRGWAASSLAFFAPLTSGLTLTNGTGSATFTRNSVQYLPDASAFVTANNPAVNAVGVLSEPTATNICLQSQAMATSPWGKGTAATVDNNDALAPDGTQTATKIILGTDYSLGGSELWQGLSVTNTTIYTASVWFKGTVGQQVYLDHCPGGTFASRPTNTQVLVTFTGQWQRVTLTCTTNVSSGWYVALGNAGFGASPLNLPGVTLWAWGMQEELGDVATSDIPTTTVSVTRAATSLSYPTSGNLYPDHPMSGTYEWTPEVVDATTRWQWGSYTDANNATGVFYDGTNITFRKRVAGTNRDATKALAAVAGTTYSIGWRVNVDNSTDVFINQVKGTGNSNTTAATIGSTFKIGDNGNGANGDVGQIRNFNVYSGALADGIM